MWLAPCSRWKEEDSLTLLHDAVPPNAPAFTARRRPMKIQLIAASVIATVGLAGCATSPGYGGGGYNNSGYNSNCLH